MKFTSALLILIFPLLSNAQNINSVTYAVSQNSLIELIKTYPEKKAKIESQIDQSPQVMQFFIVGQDVIQYNYKKDSTLFNIRIYSIKQKLIYTIDSELEVTGVDKITIGDTIKIEKSDKYYEIIEKDASPTQISTNQEINQKLHISPLDNYPEISILFLLDGFPDTIIIGQPKPMMTLLLQEKNVEYRISESSYLLFLDKIKSAKKRHEFLNKLKIRSS